jgi:hypothetical protein
MQAEAKAADAFARQLHKWSKDNDDPDGQAALLSNIMDALAQHGADPVQLLSEVGLAPGKDDGDGSHSDDDSSQEEESSDDNKEEESSSEEETACESDEDGSATSSSGSSDAESSSSDSDDDERVRVKFVCRGVPGRPDGEVRAAELKATCQWRRLQKQLWRDYGEKCSGGGGGSTRGAALQVSYLDAEGDACAVRSQRDLKVALRAHLAAAAATAAASTATLGNASLLPSSANDSGLSVSLPALPPSLRLFVDGPSYTGNRSAATVPRTTGLGVGAQRSPRRHAAPDSAPGSPNKAPFEPPLGEPPRDRPALRSPGGTAAGATGGAAAKSSSGLYSNGGGAKHGGGAPLYWTRGALLGRGAYGKVYAALDLRTGQWLAVKQVRLNGAGAPTSPVGQSGVGNPAGCDPKVVALQREISLLEDLDHPNIIKCVALDLFTNLFFV